MPVSVNADGKNRVPAKSKGGLLLLRHLLSPGQPIIIEGLSANGEEYERWSQYQSRIHKVQDDSLVVSSPRRRGTVVRFAEQSDVTLYVNRFGVRLRFQALVSNPPDTPLVIHLVGIADFQRYDHRKNVRIQLLLQPISFFVVGDEKRGINTFAPLISDISVGGIGISCLRDIPEGSAVKIEFELPRIAGRIKALAEVRRVFDPIRDNTGKRRWHMGLKFLNLSRTDLARIATFVAYQQGKIDMVGNFSKLSGH